MKDLYRIESDLGFLWLLVGVIGCASLGCILFWLSRSAARVEWIGAFADTLGFRRQIPWTPRVLVFFSGFFSLASLVILIVVSVMFYTWMEVYRSDKIAVQGRVAMFNPAAGTMRGQSVESFVVDGVRFEYDGGGGGPGYRRTAAQNGPIREGRWLKISYVHDRGGGGNVITRLSVRRRGSC